MEQKKNKKRRTRIISWFFWHHHLHGVNPKHEIDMERRTKSKKNDKVLTTK